jgi:hypothetical protein
VTIHTDVPNTSTSPRLPQRARGPEVLPRSHRAGDRSDRDHWHSTNTLYGHYAVQWEETTDGEIIRVT